MVCVHFGISLTLFVSLILQFGPICKLQSEAATFPDASDILNVICSNLEQCSKDEFKNIDPSKPFLFCCLFCSCDASCVEQHSCCPNSSYVSHDVIPYSSELDDVVCRNTLYSGKPKNVYLHPEYEFVETCLETADESTKQKCENMARTNDSLIHDHIPVYDPERRRSYANIHCAKCNIGSTTDVIVWQPKMTCDEGVDLQVISSDINLAIKEYNCEVIFVPPSDIPEIPPCFNDVIAECNITGDLAVYDELDAYFCRNLDMLFVSIVNETRKYRNVFCAKCNGEIIYADTKCPNKPSSDTTTGVTTLINYKLSDVEQIGGAIGYTQGCPRTYKYDPFTERCKQLVCSPPYYLDVTTSTCQLFHQLMSNVRMLLSYYLKFDATLQFEEVLPLVEEIYPKIRYNRAIFPCAIGEYYQTNIVAQPGNVSQGVFSNNITVTGVYLMIYSPSILDSNPAAAYKTYSDLILGAILSENHTNFIVLGPDTFDTGMLQFDDASETITIEYEEFTFLKDGSPSHYVFVNPYDNTIILGHIENKFIMYCLPNVYENDFMDCPAHIYEFTDGFRRVADGLTVKYKTTELFFPFDQFKTATSSTVRICSQAINDRINLESRSESLSYDLDLPIVSLALICVSNKLQI